MFAHMIIFECGGGMTEYIIPLFFPIKDGTKQLWWRTLSFQLELFQHIFSIFFFNMFLYVYVFLNIHIYILYLYIKQIAQNTTIDIYYIQLCIL